MKTIKKIFGFALLPTVALLVAGHALLGKKADTLSDLAKENVEALADDFIIAPVPCFENKNKNCNITIVFGDGKEGSAVIPGYSKFIPSPGINPPVPATPILI